MSRLVLVGLPGAGKSTLAEALAQRWGCEAVDTDVVIAHNVGTGAAQYLRAHGEAEFRLREVEALRSALGLDVVVATGGGIVCSAEARSLLASALTIWLDGDDIVLLGRLDDIDRPLLGHDAAEALARLRAEREAWYEEVSRARIDVSGTLDVVTARVLDEVAKVAR